MFQIKTFNLRSLKLNDDRTVKSKRLSVITLDLSSIWQKFKGFERFTGKQFWN